MKIIEIRGFDLSFPLAEPIGNALNLFRKRDVDLSLILEQMARWPMVVDINQGYTSAAAVRSARFMEDADLLWIEEPVQPEDFPGIWHLTGALLLRRPAEKHWVVFALSGILSPRAPSTSCSRLSICGGFSGFRQIWALAQAYDLPIMPHVFWHGRELSRVAPDVSRA